MSLWKMPRPLIISVILLNLLLFVRLAFSAWEVKIATPVLSYKACVTNGSYHAYILQGLPNFQGMSKAIRYRLDCQFPWAVSRFQASIFILPPLQLLLFHPYICLLMGVQNEAQKADVRETDAGIPSRISFVSTYAPQHRFYCPVNSKKYHFSTSSSGSEFTKKAVFLLVILFV